MANILIPISTKMLFAAKTLAIAIIMLLVSSNKAMGQRHEVGLFFGGMFYMGDLNPYMIFAMPHVGAGGLYRFNIDNHISLRFSGLAGSISGSDAIINHNTNRNLSFRSTIFEASLQGEVNFFDFVPGNPEFAGTPYIFGGGGVFRFNPKAQLNGQWVELNPLGTEGQGSALYPDRKIYSLTSFNLLFGVGYKFNISQHFAGAIEWGMRRTSTDYLDDVSTSYVNPIVFDNNPVARALHDRSLTNRGNNVFAQRGNPYVNDWYSFAGITITYRFKNQIFIHCPAFN